MTDIITRTDYRYTTESTGARFVAWAGERGHETMHMGFWTGEDEGDFEEAIRDELRYGAGTDDMRIIIREVQDSVADAAHVIADHVIDGMKDNAVVNAVSFAETGWDGEGAVDVYTTEIEGMPGCGEVVEACEVDGALVAAAVLVQAWLDGGKGAEFDSNRALALA
jgi:hypothetical protein